MPKRIIYRAQHDATSFDFDRYLKSLQRYDSDITEEQLKKAIDDFGPYDLLHVSCLVEIGTSLISDDEKAQDYFNEHSEWFNSTPNFERLRRITGYLVGSLERWNDGKRAEERERVKHNVSPYSQEAKDELEAQKLEYSQMSQF